MSLKIGRLFGINLFIHWSFWLLPLWVIFTHGRDPEAVPLGLHLGLLAALFGCVVLHEYGHALAARQFGIGTRDVTLYPIGGVARLERMSERPWEEFAIALAGPLVNVFIAVFLALGLFVATGVRPGYLGTPAGEFLGLLLLMNVVLFGFNLLPAFPMDGGRVLRALLTIPLGRLSATRVAVYVSVGMSVLFGVIGVWFFHNPWLVFAGLFLMWAGYQELVALELRERHGEAEAAPEILSDEPTPTWHGLPRGSITVYIWDARRHEWVPQGVIPAHSFSDPGRRVV
jgi:Zn-dependent protease